MQTTTIESLPMLTPSNEERLVKNNYFESLLFFCMFLGTLVFFGFQSARNCFEIGDGTASLEKRKLASFVTPDFRSLKRLSEFPSSFEHFFDDRFACRLGLISSRAYIRYRAFALGTNTVTVGKDGWLFYSEGEAMDYLTNDKPLSFSRLNYWGRKYLGQRSAWCEARGIKYLFYVPPLSSTIYPEKLPDGIRRSNGPSRLDQLFFFLKSFTSVNFVDLRPSLMETKAFPIYLKTDTHWNQVGAFVATNQILQRLKVWFPNITTLSGTELQTENVTFAGDLIGLVGGGSSISERTLRQKQDSVYRWKFVSPCHDAEGGAKYRIPFATEVNDPRLPTAVCIRDSFTIAQRIYLSNHFRRIVYGWWDDFPFDVIEKEHPDVVLQEKCERMIGY